jgi:7,8-dihydropterin-6-yl-methyl-4-(beta-D-ribofuranosyl)aminobenzene 5'-phosphate synthase
MKAVLLVVALLAPTVAAAQAPARVTVIGGFHLVDMNDADVTRLVLALRHRWTIARLSAGHCTGPFAFAEFIRVYADRYDRAGVGAVVPLPSGSP